jgi:hypothetical protein
MPCLGAFKIGEKACFYRLSSGFGGRISGSERRVKKLGVRFRRTVYQR